MPTYFWSAPDRRRTHTRRVTLPRMLLSFQMLPEQPAPELLDAVELADGLGYHGCYSADEIYHKDAWLLFAAAAQRTERIRLGPCVAPIYMREPTYIAQLAATLDELSGGRAEVVFGIGNIAMLEQYGVEWRGTRPIARLREAHHVMRTFLEHAGGISAATNQHGEFSSQPAAGANPQSSADGKRQSEGEWHGNVYMDGSFEADGTPTADPNAPPHPGQAYCAEMASFTAKRG